MHGRGGGVVRMIRRSTLIAVEILLGLVAALLIGVGVAWWRLSQGPVELNFIRQHVQAELSDARSGRPVGIERVELAWSQQASALELRAVGVTVEDGRGGVLSRSEEARIELDALPLLVGRISVVRAEFNGGEIIADAKNQRRGACRVWPARHSARHHHPAASAERNAWSSASHACSMGCQAAFRPVGPGGRLRALGVRNARLADHRRGRRRPVDRRRGQP